MLATPAAYAQTYTLGFLGKSNTTFPINRDACNNGDSVQVTWQASGLGTGNTCGNLQVFVTNAAGCPSTPSFSSTDGGTADVALGTVSQTDLATLGSGTLNNLFKISSMPGLGGTCPDAVDISNAICGSLNYRAVGTTTCTTLGATNTPTLRYDAQPPRPPTVSLIGQDAKIVVTLGANGETELLAYRVEYAPMPPGDAGASWITLSDLAATKSSVTIGDPANNGGLVNGQKYVVRARSLDEVSNLSDFSAEQTATPQASNGFWAEYKSAGGSELGGCSTADATLPSLVGVLTVIATLLWRRR